MIDYRNKPWWLLMAVPIVINCCIGLSYQTLGVYLSAYVMNELGATATQFGMVSTLWTVVACIMRPASGPMAQKYGSKSIMLIGLAIWTGMIAAFGFVTTFVAWGICRVIQCFGHAISYTLSQSAAAEAAPKKDLGKAANLYVGIPQVLAVVVGPAIGLAFIGDNQWQRFFLLTSLIGLLGVVLGIIFLPGKKQSEELLAINNADNKEQLAKDEAIEYHGVWKVLEKSALPASVIMIFCSFAHLAMMFFSAYVIFQYGELGGAAIFSSLYGLMQLPLMFVLGPIQDKFGTKVIFFPAVLFCALATAMLAMGNTNWVLLGILYGIGQAGIKPVLNGQLVKACPMNRVSVATGTYQMANGVGLGLAAFFGGLVIDNMGYAAMWWYCTILFVLCGVACLLVIKEPWLKTKNAAA